jgi:hypothetical protein
MPTSLRAYATCELHRNKCCAFPCADTYRRGIIFAGVAVLEYIGAIAALIGFTPVIIAAILVLREGLLTGRQLDSELLDAPDPAQSTGQESGNISE